MTFRAKLTVVAGTHNPRMAVKTTLGPYIDDYLREQRKIGRLSAETARKNSYRLRRLADSFGQRPIGQMNRQAIEHWLAGLCHLAPSTRRLHLSTAGTFCRWLVYKGAIRKDPTVGIIIRKARSVPRALSPQQLAQFLPALPDERAEVIVTLMLQLGLRACEVSRSRTEDYDPDSLTLLVTGKGGHQRMLPVTAEAAAILDRYLSHRGVVAGPLIMSRNEPWKGLTAGTISTLLSRWMKAAGIKHRRFDGISGHALRHTAASDTLDRCGDLEEVREMLGHVSLTTTQIYLRRAHMGRLREAMEGRSYLLPTGTVGGRDPTLLRSATALRGAASPGVCAPEAGDPTEGPGSAILPRPTT